MRNRYDLVSMELTDADVARIESLIRGVVGITCRRWSLRREQVGDDMAQDCWAEVLRVKDRYDPGRGASLLTFLYLSITRVSGRFALRERRRGTVEFDLDDRHRSFGDPQDDLEFRADLAGLDVRVAAAAMGLSDEEIAAMLREPVRETTRRRRAAARDARDARSLATDA